MKLFKTMAACAFAALSLYCAAPAPENRAGRQIIERYQASPILFTENAGRAPADVDFVSSGLGHTIRTRRSGADIFVPGTAPNTANRISIQLQNASKAAHGELEEATATRSGFQIDGRLVSGLVNYRRVRYSNVWPGTDVVYYGTGQQFEYDFVLRPGADVRQIKLRFDGAQSFALNASGDLVLKTPAREVVQHKPVLYQTIGGVRTEVAGGYQIGPNGQVTFEVGPYDRSKELVIDPILGYAVSSIHQTAIQANGIAVDGSGNAYVVGQTFSVGPPPNCNPCFGTDMFLAKLDPTGTLVGTIFELGGSQDNGNTTANAVALDSAGNVYVAGQTSSNGLVAGCSNCGFQSTLANAPATNYDGFLISLAPTFVQGPHVPSVNYITYIGGSGNDIANGVAVLSPSAVYVAGSTTSTDFPKSIGNALSGPQDAFLVKVDTTQITGPGSKVWARYVGGSGSDTGNGVAVDTSGNVYLVGATTSTSISPGPTTNSAMGFQTSYPGGTDGFLDKLDPTGANCLYFTYFTNGQATAVATSGNTAYVTGLTTGSLGNVTASAAQSSFGGGTSDGFLFRVDTSQSFGASLIYSTYLGGTGNDQGSSIAASGGVAYVVGVTTGGFPIKNAMQGTYSGGASGGFYTVVDTNLSGANSLASSSYLGGSVSAAATGVAVIGSEAVVSAAGSNAAQAYQVFNPTNFVPVTPCRVADTRNSNGPFGGPFIAASSFRSFVIPSSACGIPATAQAYSLNVTVVPHGQLGFVTVWPTGGTQPVASTLNSFDGRVKANAAIVAGGNNGAVSAFASNDTDLILDINGYFVSPNEPNALAFYPLTPCRVADTRNANGPLGGPFLSGNAAGRAFPIRSSACGIPAGATAYSLNFTAIPHGALGFLATWPTGQNQPIVSTLNAFTGTVTANAAIVPAGTNGNISVFASNDSDLAIDVNGYFAPPGLGGQSLYTLAPCRVFDSRNQGSPFSGEKDVTVQNVCGVPSAAHAYVLNATVIPNNVLSFLSLWAQGQTQPGVSTLNAFDAAVTSNMAIVPTLNGSISTYVTDPTHLFLDISGFFAP